MAPHAIDPYCFDFLLEPDCRLKLTSICVGPFDRNPTGLKLKVKMRDFKNVNLWHCNEAINEGKSMQQLVIFQANESKFYVLLVFNLPEIVISEDLCIMISTEKKAKIKNFAPIKFRYWLNAKGVKERVGANAFVHNIPVDNIDFKNLLPANYHSTQSSSHRSPQLNSR